MKRFLLLFYAILPFLLPAQQYDRYWITGYRFSTNGPYEGNLLDFSTSPPTVAEVPVSIETVGAAGAISDFSGNLQFYTNGGQIRAADHHLMENGDSLSPSALIYDFANGFPLFKSLAILPGTHDPSRYHVVHQRADICPQTSVCLTAVLSTQVDMAANIGAGRVVSKNRPLVSAASLDMIDVCRHGNGRDWWIVVPDYWESRFYTVLYNDLGVRDSFVQQVGYKPDWTDSLDGGANNVFSPDGTKYVDHDPRNGLRLFDFDRCTGTLGNFRHLHFGSHLPIGSSVVFSPNSRFLYVSASGYLFQVDTDAPDLAASLDTVAVWDGFYSPEPPFATNFGAGQLMPDGKIYFAPNNGVYHLHYIEYPDLPGDSCTVVQHGLEVPHVFARSVPLIPNYRLYDLPGSPCDSLGIDGPPVVSTRPPADAPAWRLYPNPAADWLAVESSLLPDQPVRFEVYDLSGRQVLAADHPTFTRSYRFDVRAVPPGLYTARLVAVKGRSWATRVCIAR